MIGSIVVETEPDGASVIIIEPIAGDVKKETTPARFENLFEGSYQVMISKPGFRSYSTHVDIQAGHEESVNVALQIKEKTFFEKYWPYGAGAVAALTIIAVLSSGGDEPPPPVGKDLPYPPVRP